MEKIATNLLPDFLPDFDLVQYVQTSRRCKNLFTMRFPDNSKNSARETVRKISTKGSRDSAGTAFPLTPIWIIVIAIYSVGKQLTKDTHYFVGGITWGFAGVV